MLVGAPIMVAGTPGMAAPVVADLREFLARALPWPQPGEAQNFVNIHHAFRLTNSDGSTRTSRSGHPQISMPGMACRSIDEAVRQINWANSIKTDVYICMSAQREGDAATNRLGRPYYKAIRRIENILTHKSHKSLYIDVDVKPDDLAHGYASFQDAAIEFIRIRDTLGLPRQTFVVLSGSGGFHAHWCLTEAIPLERWRLLSGALSAALLYEGFRGDTQCIVDGVRLLRPPSTCNYKRAGAPAPVTLWGIAGDDHDVARLEAVLKPFEGMVRTQVPVHKYVNGIAPPSTVFANVNLAPLDAGLDVFNPSIEEVAAICPFIARTLATGGADNVNAVRLQTCNLSLFCKEPRVTAHRLTNKRSTCPPEETDALIDRQRQTTLLRDMGWPQCATIASYGPSECTSCPHLRKGKSPLNYVARSAVQPGSPPATTPVAAIVQSSTITPAPTQALASLPSIYAYDAVGRVQRVITDSDGAQTFELLSQFPVMKPWLQQAPPAINFATETHQGVSGQIKLPYEVINDKNKFASCLAKQGVLPTKRQLDPLGEFFVAFIDKLRADRTNVVQSQSFGWLVRQGKVEGFVYAGHLWSKDIPKPAANTDPVLASQYQPIGEIQPWLDAAKLITNQERPALDAMLASAFAAPLVRFTGQSGLLLSTYSTHSGIGKSTALKVAQAVWGHPIKAAQALSDTQNSVIKKLGDIKNLPLFWDELKTSDDTAKFFNLAFQLSGGKEKSRLSADTSYREPGIWQTMLCCTSNDSLLAYILAHTKTTAAGIYRIFEFDVKVGVKGQISPAEAAMTIGALNDNYGMAGVTYAQFLGANHERIAADIRKYSLDVEKAYDLRADERFWMSLIVTIIMGASYANELGLTTINIDLLARFMMEKLQAMRNERVTSNVDIHTDLNVLAIVGRYINEHRHYHGLLTNTIWRGPGRPPPPQQGIASVYSVGDTNRIRDVRIHIGEDQWVRFFKEPWDEWLTAKGYAPALINKQLMHKFGVQLLRGRLGVGTLMQTGAEPLFEFNHADPVFQNLLEM